MKKRGRRNFYIYLLLAVILVLSAVFLSAKAYNEYSQWKFYRDYFERPDAKIESWMSAGMISKNFGKPD